MVTNWFQTIISLIQLVHMYASEMPVIFAFVFPPVSLCQFIQILEAVRLHFINNSLRISLRNCRRTDILYLTDTSVVWTFDGWLFEARHWPLRMHLWIWFWRRFPFHLKKKTGHMNHMNQPELSRAYFAGISSLYMWVRLHVWAYQKFGRVSALFKTRHYLWFRIEIGVLSNWEHGDGDGDGENPRVLHIWVPIKQAINRRSLITFATAHLVRLWSPAWSWIFLVVVFFPLFFSARDTLKFEFEFSQVRYLHICWYCQLIWLPATGGTSGVAALLLPPSLTGIINLNDARVATD